MIYEDERTVDEMVDDILSTVDEGVREEKTVSAGGMPSASRPDTPGAKTEERVACRRCGKLFTRRMGSGRSMCEECFRMSHSRKRPAAKNDPAASSRQIKPEDEVQRAWNALEETAGGDQTPGSFGPDGPQDDKRKKPEDMTAGELVDALADGMRKEPGDVALALYQAARDVARAAGIQTRILIETMYEIDQVLSHVGGV